MADAATLNEDFVNMLQALSDSNVEFLIVGAHAMAAHGLPRATGDIDIFVRPERGNAGRVMSALRTFGAPIDDHGVTQLDFEQAGTVYQIGLPPRRIDLLTEINGVTFDEAWGSRIEAQLAGRRVAVLVLLPRRIDLPLACSSPPWRPRASSKYEEYSLAHARAPRTRSPARSSDQYALGAALGRAALLRNKLATGRDKDLVDARWLERSVDGDRSE